MGWTMINSHCNLLQILSMKTDKINTSKFTLEYPFQNIYSLTISSKIDSKCCFRSNTIRGAASLIRNYWLKGMWPHSTNKCLWFTVKLKFVFMSTTIISKKKWKGLWNSLSLFFFFGVYVMIYLFGLFLHVKKRKKERVFK